MTFDCHLSWTHRSEGIDHAETITTARCNGEYFQGGICHKAGVGVTELTLAVNQQRFGILASVDSQTAGITFGSILVQPITDQHNVGGQIKVIQMGVGIPRGWLTYNDTAIETIQLLETCVGVPEMCTSIASPLITAREENYLHNIMFC